MPKKAEQPKLPQGLAGMSGPKLKSREDFRHLPLGTVTGGFFYTGDKPFGVEPGFIGVKIDRELLLRLVKAGVLEKSDETKINEMQESQMPGFLDEKMSELHKLVDKKPLQQELPEKKILIESHNKILTLEEARATGLSLTKEAHESMEKKIKALGEVVKDLNTEGKSPTGNLKLFLIKQLYLKGKPYPSRYRLAMTSFVKKNPWALPLYEAGKRNKASEKKENINALLETLANDVAGLAMTVQNQTLQTKEGDEDPGFVTVCEWEKNLEMFTGCLAGSKGHEKYLVKMTIGTDGEPIPYKNDQGLYESDNSVNLGPHAAMMILLGDNDTIGSQGQNKGRKGNQLFGLDFGHAFRDKPNPLIKHLRTDLGFNGNSSFKNMGTMFHDTELSERMQGMFYLYKMMGEDNRKEFFGKKTSLERKNIEAAIVAYGEKYSDFAVKMEEIKDGSLIEMFNQYEENMTEPEHKSAVKDAKETVTDSLREMSSLMDARMQLSPDEVDLLQNLERLSSKTTQASKDGKVLLKHLQVADPKHGRVEWNMTKANGNMILTTSLSSDQEATKLIKLLKDYQNNNSSVETTFYVTKKQGKSIVTFEAPEAGASKLLAAFSEENIKNFKSKKEHDLGVTPQELKGKTRKLDIETRGEKSPVKKNVSPKKAEENLKSYLKKLSKASWEPWETASNTKEENKRPDRQLKATFLSSRKAAKVEKLLEEFWKNQKEVKGKSDFGIEVHIEENIGMLGLGTSVIITYAKDKVQDLSKIFSQDTKDLMDEKKSTTKTSKKTSKQKSEETPPPPPPEEPSLKTGEEIPPPPPEPRDKKNKPTRKHREKTESAAPPPPPPEKEKSETRFERSSKKKPKQKAKAELPKENQKSLGELLQNLDTLCSKKTTPSTLWSKGKSEGKDRLLIAEFSSQKEAEHFRGFVEKFWDNKKGDQSFGIEVLRERGTGATVTINCAKDNIKELSEVFNKEAITAFKAEQASQKKGAGQQFSSWITKKFTSSSKTSAAPLLNADSNAFDPKYQKYIENGNHPKWVNGPKNQASSRPSPADQKAQNNHPENIARGPRR